MFWLYLMGVLGGFILGFMAGTSFGQFKEEHKRDKSNVEAKHV